MLMHLYLAVFGGSHLLLMPSSVFQHSGPPTILVTRTETNRLTITGNIHCTCITRIYMYSKQGLMMLSDLTRGGGGWGSRVLALVFLCSGNWDYLVPLLMSSVWLAKLLCLSTFLAAEQPRKASSGAARDFREFDLFPIFSWLRGQRIQHLPANPVRCASYFK